MANNDALQAIRNGAAYRQNIFKALDRDGDGTLNELKGAIDTNGDGYIDFKTEYTVGVEGLNEIARGYFSYSIAKRGITLDLYRANLSKANLSRAILSGANLSRANLSGADLYKAYLDKANLSKANLSKAILLKANLSKADLSGANLSKVIYIDSADLDGARGIFALRHPWLFLRSF